MIYDPRRMFEDLMGLINRVQSLETDDISHTADIADIKKQIRSERSKRGWKTRETNKMQFTLAQLIDRVADLEAKGSQDDNEASEIVDEIEAHVNHLH